MNYLFSTGVCVCVCSSVDGHAMSHHKHACPFHLRFHINYVFFLFAFDFFPFRNKLNLLTILRMSFKYFAATTTTTKVSINKMWVDGSFLHVKNDIQFLCIIWVENSILIKVFFRRSRSKTLLVEKNETKNWGRTNQRQVRSKSKLLIKYSKEIKIWNGSFDYAIKAMWHTKHRLCPYRIDYVSFIACAR